MSTICQSTVLIFLSQIPIIPEGWNTLVNLQNNIFAKTYNYFDPSRTLRVIQNI